MNGARPNPTKMKFIIALVLITVYWTSADDSESNWKERMKKYGGKYDANSRFFRS